ncbi:hypothetical protein LX36DRAFT_372783 [Colletotrichum falcatum]|nr:hypothetical protein LX36DRAFT_372783 [Colletotrichum falcatum]
MYAGERQRREHLRRRAHRRRCWARGRRLAVYGAAPRIVTAARWACRLSGDGLGVVAGVESPSPRTTWVALAMSALSPSWTRRSQASSPPPPLSIPPRRLPARAAQASTLKRPPRRASPSPLPTRTDYGVVLHTT